MASPYSVSKPRIAIKLIHYSKTWSVYWQSTLKHFILYLHIALNILTDEFRHFEKSEYGMMSKKITFKECELAKSVIFCHGNQKETLIFLLIFPLGPSQNSWYIPLHSSSYVQSRLVIYRLACGNSESPYNQYYFG